MQQTERAQLGKNHHVPSFGTTALYTPAICLVDFFFKQVVHKNCLSGHKQTGMDLPGEIGVKKTSLRPTSLKKKLTRHMGALSTEAKRETFKTD